MTNPPIPSTSQGVVVGTEPLELTHDSIDVKSLNDAIAIVESLADYYTNLRTKGLIKAKVG